MPPAAPEDPYRFVRGFGFGTLALLANELLWRTMLAAGAPAPGSLAWSAGAPTQGA